MTICKFTDRMWRKVFNCTHCHTNHTHYNVYHLQKKDTHLAVLEYLSFENHSHYEIHTSDNEKN